MAHARPFPFLELPTELQRRVFILAAAGHSTKTDHMHPLCRAQTGWFGDAVFMAELLLALDEVQGTHKALLRAVSSSRSDVVKAVLGSGVPANPDGSSSALGVAASLGNTETVRLLLTAPVSPAMAGDGDALHHAVVHGHLDTVRLLVSFPVNPAHADAQDSRVLKTAVDHNQSVEMVELLLTAPTHPAKANAVTVLQTAALNMNIGVARRLLSVPENAARADAYDSVALTTATMAAFQHEAAVGEAMVELLLNAGARGNARHNFALAVAVSVGNPNLVRMLLHAPSHPAQANSRGGSIITDSIQHGNAAVVKLLLEAPDGPAIPTRDMLEQAAELGHAEVVQLLKDALPSSSRGI